MNALLCIDKEEQFILDDGAAKAAPQDIKVKRSPGNLGIIDFITDRTGAFHIIIHRSPELIRTAAGNGVDTGACEPALSYVIRSYVHLDLVDGVQRDWLGIGLAAKCAG